MPCAVLQLSVKAHYKFPLSLLLLDSYSACGKNSFSARMFALVTKRFLRFWGGLDIRSEHDQCQASWNQKRMDTKCIRSNRSLHWEKAWLGKKTLRGGRDIIMASVRHWASEPLPQFLGGDGCCYDACLHPVMLSKLALVWFIAEGSSGQIQIPQKGNAEGVVEDGQSRDGHYILRGVLHLQCSVWCVICHVFCGFWLDLVT